MHGLEERAIVDGQVIRRRRGPISWTAAFRAIFRQRPGDGGVPNSAETAEDQQGPFRNLHARGVKWGDPIADLRVQGPWSSACSVSPHAKVRVALCVEGTMNKYQSQSKARLSKNLLDPVDVLMAVDKETLERRRRAFAKLRRTVHPHTEPEGLCMDRIDHLIETFRGDHPDVDATVLLEFAQHLRRVLIDELRAELKAGDVAVAVSMQLHGHAFSAKGPRSYVEGLLAGWTEAAAAPSMKNITPGFNRMKLISGR